MIFIIIINFITIITSLKSINDFSLKIKHLELKLKLNTYWS